MQDILQASEVNQKPLQAPFRVCLLPLKPSVLLACWSHVGRTQEVGLQVECQKCPHAAQRVNSFFSVPFHALVQMLLSFIFDDDGHWTFN